jgi:hypothetical protein
MMNILHMHKDPLLVVMKMNIEVRFFTFFMLRIFSDIALLCNDDNDSCGIHIDLFDVEKCW